jgi:signal peptidase I
MGGIAERLANLDWKTVLAVIVVLVGVRYALIKQGSQSAKSIAEIAESLAIALGLVFLVIRPFFIQAFFIPSQSMFPTLIGDKEIPLFDHIMVNKTVYRIRDPKYKDIVVFHAPPEALVGPEFVDESGALKQTDFIKRCIGVPGDVVYVTQGYIATTNGAWSHDQLRGFFDFGARVRIKKDGLYVDGQRLSDEDLAQKLNVIGKIGYRPGQVFINGKPLDEPYIAEDPEYPYPALDQSSGDPGGRAMAANLLKAEQRGKLKIIRDGGPLRVKLMPGEYLMMGDNRNKSFDSRYWGPLDRDRVVGRAMFIFFPIGRTRWVR